MANPSSFQQVYQLMQMDWTHDAASHLIEIDHRSVNRR